MKYVKRLIPNGEVRAISIKRIAEMTGLSTATVSHALSGDRKVSDANREKVLRAAEQINYRPNHAARILKTQKSKTVAFIVPAYENNRNANLFYTDLLAGLMRKLSETEYDVIVSSYDGHGPGERSLRAVQVCRKQWVDAVVLVPSSTNPEQLNVLRNMDVPFALADRRVDGAGFSCVESDNEAGAAGAVELLARCGRKRIGFIGEGKSVSTGIARLAGYRRAAEGLGYGDLYVETPARYSIEDGGRCAAALLEKGVDGIVVADNTLTMGVLRELNRLNARIPEDLGIVGYDDYDWMELTSPPLTTVRQQVGHMGYLAADMVLRKLTGAGCEERVMLGTDIVLRGSHGHLTDEQNRRGGMCGADTGTEAAARHTRNEGTER